MLGYGETVACGFLQEVTAVHKRTNLGLPNSIEIMWRCSQPALPRPCNLARRPRRGMRSSTALDPCGSHVSLVALVSLVGLRLASLRSCPDQLGMYFPHRFVQGVSAG